MAEIMTERERLIVKAGMGIAHVMHDYASAGYDDYEEVGRTLAECMAQITDKLDDNLKAAFARWLITKTVEADIEIKVMSEN